MHEEGFTKLFSTIVTSTIWQEDAETCKIWVTLLALANRYGEVSATIPGIARLTNIPIEKIESAIAKFQEPDKYSRSRLYDGRRLEVVDGGHRLLNYSYYREKSRSTDRREYLRQKQAERRERIKQECQQDVNKVNQNQPIAEAEAEADITTMLSWEVDFEEFWKTYPRKISKGKARDWWERHKPEGCLKTKILTSIQQQKTTEQWRKDGGQFIPHPITWLNQERWDDEIKVSLGKPDKTPRQREQEAAESKARAQASQDELLKRFEGVCGKVVDITKTVPTTKSTQGEIEQRRQKFISELNITKPAPNV